LQDSSPRVLGLPGKYLTRIGLADGDNHTSFKYQLPLQKSFIVQASGR
jgi:hypothetical protein